MAEKPQALKEYRLLGDSFHKKVDKVLKHFKKGDLVSLTLSQYEAFKDQFEPKEAAELRAKEKLAVDAAKAKVKAEAAPTSAKPEPATPAKEG